MKNLHCDCYKPISWTHSCENIDVERVDYNMFDMAVISIGEVDDETPLEDYEDNMISFELKDNIITLIQHRTNVVNK